VRNYNAIAHLIKYLPFGEVFIEERNNSWNTPYLFNGKELDEETGLYYYGARYYNPRESVWLSVDPIAEKYPNVSPYAYTFQNPVRYTDPTGMKAEWHEDKDNKNVLVKDKGDNAKTLKEYVNKNYKNAKLNDKAAENLYNSIENERVNLDQLNPETLNKNIFGYNYPGPDNPKKYNGESDYSTPPKFIELAAFLHDQDYDKVGAVGTHGLFIDSKTIEADLKFVERMDKIIEYYKKEDRQILVAQAAIIKLGVGVGSAPKRKFQQINNKIKKLFK
jgi:RHS repeat-associated protein